MKKILLSFLSMLSSLSLIAQTVATDVSTVQPTVLVVPFTSTGESALSLYEQKFEYRTIVNEISNAINKRGFSPQDLQEVIAKIKENSAIKKLDDVETNPIQEILDNTSADIVVKAEINVNNENNSVGILMKAIDKATGKVLFTSPLLSSPSFKTTDYAYIVQRLLNQDDAIGTFLTGLSGELQKVVLNGRSIQISIVQNANSTYNLEDENTNGDYLSDLFIDWVKKNAYKNYYKIKTQTAKELYFDEVRIPIKDETGNNYDINTFAREVRKAVATICSQKDGVKPKVETPKVANGIIRIILP
ncbi:MAG: DUF6175 family protein [Chitinophagales bacterium]